MKYLKFNEYVTETDIKRYSIVHLNNDLFVVRKINDKFKKFMTVENGELVKVKKGDVDLSPEELMKKIVYQSDNLSQVINKMNLLINRF